MSTVKSWAIVANNSRRSRSSPSRNAPQSLEPAVGMLQTSFQQVRSTGFFPTPPDEGIPTNLSIFLSSFDTETRRVTVRVNRLFEDTVEEIFARTLDVPSAEARRLDVEGVAGQVIEIRIDAAEDIVPSASIAQYFVADGGIVVQEYRSPTDFVLI